MFPAYPSIQASVKPLEGVGTQYIGEVAGKYLGKFTTKDEADTMYGLYDKAGKFYIGNKLAIIDDNDLVVGKDEYEGTPGLRELIVSKEPKNFNGQDYENYGRLMIKTNALYRGNDPENKRPKSSKSYKWNNILKDIWLNRKEYEEGQTGAFPRVYEERLSSVLIPGGYEGKGVIVIPSDPNALVKRLGLLLASKEAGNTGVENEAVAICNELKRQGHLGTRSYKILNSIIKK